MSNKKYGIVTGASRGLGAAIAEELAREGYNLVITYSGQKAKAEGVKGNLEKTYGVNIEIYKLSVQHEDEVAAFRKWAEEKMGTDLAVLVNNAGTYCNVPADEIEPALFCDIIDVNVKGTFFMCRYFADLMKANHFGKIINLCSAVGLRAAPGSHKTDMYYDAYKIDPELMDARTKQCPLQRAGEVSEMWYVVRYFMESDFITGQVVSPNGGTTMV